MTRALLQQALDALKDSYFSDEHRNYELQAKAIAALREALNAPEPEPYGHVTTHTVTGQQFFYRYPSPPYLDTAKECIAVYAAPPAAPDHFRNVAEKVAPAAPQAELLTIDQEKALSAEAKTGPFQHTTPVVGNDMQSGETLRLSSKRHAGSTPPAAPAPAAPVVPDLKHCACEFDGDTCVTQCKLHAAHVDAIHEWAERAKAAEAKLSAAPVVREPQPEPVQRLMRFAGKKRSEVRNPCLTAREAIVIADWMQAHGITGASK